MHNGTGLDSYFLWDSSPANPSIENQRGTTGLERYRLHLLSPLIVYAFTSFLLRSSTPLPLPPLLRSSTPRPPHRPLLFSSSLHLFFFVTLMIDYCSRWSCVFYKLMSTGKANRYVWQANEEEALLNILDELVASGQRCDTGTFKAGTMKLVETQLILLIPHTPIRVKPHLDSKSKRLKKDYSLVVDMLNQSGFAWNDEKKCVEVDSDEVWNAYAEHHSYTVGWRDKSFTKFDRL